jgi:hypothetical protein
MNGLKLSPPLTTSGVVSIYSPALSSQTICSVDQGLLSGLICWLMLTLAVTLQAGLSGNRLTVSRCSAVV